MTTLFISDIHLDPQRPAVTRAFFEFLNGKASECEALYILGDLFEAWVGDDDPSPLAREVVAELRRLRESGVALYFMRGNRDFMVGRSFIKQTGGTLLPELTVIDLHGNRTLLLHGDTLCIDDTDYQRYRRRIRNPVAWWTIRCRSLAYRQKLAERWRSASMAANTGKSDNLMDVSTSEVERLLTKYRATTMIHGHTHRPGRHHHANGERLVLGDWKKNGWYIEATPSGFELVSFPISE